MLDNTRSRISLILAILFLILGLIAIVTFRSEEAQNQQKSPISCSLRYGLSEADYCFEEKRVEPNQFFASILFDLGYDDRQVLKLVESTKDLFNPRSIRSGKSFTIAYSKISGKAESMVYPINQFEYIDYDLINYCADICTRKVTSEVVSHSGIIMSSLWQTMAEENLPFELIDKMEDVFAWSIDFHHVQKGDRFKLIYETLTVDGVQSISGDILGAVFESMGNEHYAVRFESDKYGGYFDLDGQSLKRAFLKAPVRYSRISSRYNRNRLHPVLKTSRPHFGTDYAAPHGTPVFAVADGVVIKASSTKGNGNFVKLKHSDNIRTQYLHLSRFAKGVRPGVHVRQGETIGYVGQTGLATGPHVCFRFWKNGKQVDHLRENLPPPEPIPDDQISHFEVSRNLIKSELDKIPYKKARS